MTKLLFLNPPSLTAENVVRDSIYGCWCKGKRIGGAMTPPYPQLLLATVMKEEGYEVELIDALAQDVSFAELEEKIKEFDFLILLTSVMTFNEDEVIINLLREKNKNLKTVIYGSLPTFMPDFCLDSKAVDFIVRREAEFALRDFLNEYTRGDGEKWKNVNGIGYRENGEKKVNDFYPFIENLDELPFADWSLLKGGNKYFNPSIKRYPYVTDLTTRGCPSKCIFCMSPAFYGHKVRGRSVENVLEGFRKHIREGYKEVYLRDEMFTMYRKRNREICRAMIQEKMDLTWLCSAKVGTVNREDIELMKEAGCHTLKIGVETGSQEILNNIKKDITIEQVRETFKLTKEIGIDTHAHIMIGHPGETESTIKQTIDFVKEINPTTVTFAMMTPYPGTELFNIVLQKYPELGNKYTLKLEDLHTKTYYTDAYCDMPAEDLSEWVKEAHRSFYLRPSYMVKWLTRIRSYNDLVKVVKAGFNVISFSRDGD
ncbi:MAG TPA: radical SAM protein [Thermodesulfovibrionales bacterium]|nr:radical SAM protein [Thermodesulfovibrionales bacterium]